MFRRTFLKALIATVAAISSPLQLFGKLAKRIQHIKPKRAGLWLPTVPYLGKKYVAFQELDSKVITLVPVDLNLVKRLDSTEYIRNTEVLAKSGHNLVEIKVPNRQSAFRLNNKPIPLVYYKNDERFPNYIKVDEAVFSRISDPLIVEAMQSRLKGQNQPKEETSTETGRIIDLDISDIPAKTPVEYDAIIKDAIKDADALYADAENDVIDEDVEFMMQALDKKIGRPVWRIDYEPGYEH